MEKSRIKCWKEGITKKKLRKGEIDKWKNSHIDFIIKYIGYLYRFPCGRPDSSGGGVTTVGRS